MNSRIRNQLTYLIALMIIVIGATRVMTSVIQSYGVTNPETPEGFNKYQTYHSEALPGFVFVAIGLAFLAYSIIGREIPLWRIRETGGYRTRRSALVVAIGTGVATLGFGASAILIHLMLTMPESVTDYDAKVADYGELARVRAIVGLIGAAVFSFGILFSREPELELGDERSLFHKRPLWQGVLVTALGIAIALMSWYYGATRYAGYVERDEGGRLTLIIFSGMGVSFLVFLVGLTMMANRVPSIHFRGPSYPRDSDFWRKR